VTTQFGIPVHTDSVVQSWDIAQFTIGVVSVLFVSVDVLDTVGISTPPTDSTHADVTLIFSHRTEAK